MRPWASCASACKAQWVPRRHGSPRSRRRRRQLRNARRLPPRPTCAKTPGRWSGVPSLRGCCLVRRSLRAFARAMARVPESPMEPAQPLVGRARSLLDQLLRIAQTRLELLSAEIQSEKLALTRQWQIAVLAVVLGSLAGVTLIVWLAVTLPVDMRTTVLGAIFVLLI